MTVQCSVNYTDTSITLHEADNSQPITVWANIRRRCR